MKSKWYLWQCAFECLLVTTLFPLEATASGLQVSPVSLTLQATQNADGIWLSNAGEKEVNAQVRVYRWSQSNFSDIMSPSQGLVISPPILAVKPGERQLIRVIRTRPASGEVEDAYRLSINELPLVSRGHNKLQFVVHYSLPVFIQPDVPEPISTKLRWTVSRIGKGIFVDVYNQGNSHAQLSAATLIDSSGLRLVISPGLLGYVLPGSTMRWILPTSVSNSIHGVKLEVTINGKKTEQNL